MNTLSRLLLVLVVAFTACDRVPKGTPVELNAGGRVEWIDPKTIQPRPIRRDVLSDEQMVRIRTLQAKFAEVDGQVVEQWVENIKRDADPDRELRVWERMAQAYRAYCEGKKLSAAATKDVYCVVLLRSMAPEQEVLKQVKLAELSHEEVIIMMKGF